jgi:hypothetical protein
VVRSAARMYDPDAPSSKRALAHLERPGVPEQRLDDAREIDPAGESAERAQRARIDIASSMNREAGPPDKPPKP